MSHNAPNFWKSVARNEELNIQHSKVAMTHD